MKNMVQPLLSIIVPTKNREQYAFSVARQVLAFPHDNIQLIIQNNSDTNKLGKMLSEFYEDKRLKYQYTDTNISTIDNFSEAIDLSEGEYLCVIGDDDGINPEIIKIVLWAKKNNIPAIKPGLKAVYSWPQSGISMNKKNHNNGVLNISGITCSVSSNNPRKELIRLMKDGCQKYLERDLVKLYHGIVKRAYMEDIKKITGSYFGGLSPDIYSAIALSSLIETVVCIDYPLTIAGICKESTSADSATGKHTGNLEDAPHFNGHENYHWADEVPKFYSVDTIWADSALASVRDMKENDLLTCFNITALTAKCLIYYPQYSQIIQECFWNINKHRNTSKIIHGIKLCFYLCRYPFINLMPRMWRRLTRKIGVNVCITDLKDIIAAEKALTNHLNNCGISLDKELGV